MEDYLGESLLYSQSVKNASASLEELVNMVLSEYDEQMNSGVWDAVWNDLRGRG